MELALESQPGGGVFVGVVRRFLFVICNARKSPRSGGATNTNQSELSRYIGVIGLVGSDYASGGWNLRCIVISDGGPPSGDVCDRETTPRAKTLNDARRPSLPTTIHLDAL